MFYIDINLVFTDYIIYKYCIGIIWLIQTLITSKKNIGSILEQTIKYNQHVSITTESGNAVIICKPTTPPYEKLQGQLFGAYSHHINIKHRLVYEVIEKDKIIKIISMWTHYEF